MILTKRPRNRAAGYHVIAFMIRESWILEYLPSSQHIWGLIPFLYAAHVVVVIVVIIACSHLRLQPFIFPTKSDFVNSHAETDAHHYMTKNCVWYKSGPSFAASLAIERRSSTHYRFVSSMMCLRWPSKFRQASARNFHGWGRGKVFLWLGMAFPTFSAWTGEDD